MNDGSTKTLDLEPSDFSPSCQESFIALKYGHVMETMNECNNNICYSFHLAEEASIKKIHMHCYVKNLLTIAHDHMEEKAKEQGRIKNTPSSEVEKMISSGEVGNY